MHADMYTPVQYPMHVFKKSNGLNTELCEVVFVTVSGATFTLFSVTLVVEKWL